VRGVDGVGDAVDVGVAAAQRLVQRRAAGQHDVGPAQQALLAIALRLVEDRGLLMAVVDQRPRPQRLGQRQRGGGVEPGERLGDAALAQEARQQALHHGQLLVVEAGRVAARVRHQHLDARRHLGRLEPGVLVRGVRFLDVVDAVMLCNPGQQLLRSLPVETPAAGGEDDQRRAFRRAVVASQGVGQGVRSGVVHGPVPRACGVDTCCRRCCARRLKRGAGTSMG